MNEPKILAGLTLLIFRTVSLLSSHLCFLNTSVHCRIPPQSLVYLLFPRPAQCNSSPSSSSRCHQSASPVPRKVSSASNLSTPNFLPTSTNTSPRNETSSIGRLSRRRREQNARVLSLSARLISTKPRSVIASQSQIAKSLIKPSSTSANSIMQRHVLSDRMEDAPSLNTISEHNHGILGGFVGSDLLARLWFGEVYTDEELSKDHNN